MALPQARQYRFAAMTDPHDAPKAGITDFHSHLIPGVDDGAQGPANSAIALARFRTEGVTQVITTPHFLGSLTHNADRCAARLAELDAGWDVLQEMVAADAKRVGTPLLVKRGVELMLDVPKPDLSDPRLRLAGGPFALVEYPSMMFPPVNAELALTSLRDDGWTPVMAHPERYRNLEASLADLARFKNAGACLQVNVGSLFGDYGRTAAVHARNIFGLGWADYVSSDYHTIGEPGCARFVQALCDAGFSEQAELLTVTNPGRLLEGNPPLAVPPAELPRIDRSLWERIMGE
jgi:protein-tyrosine phosphatase